MPIVFTPQLFAILSQSNHEKIHAALETKFPSSYLVLFTGQWLLVTSGVTVKEVSDQLGISIGDSGSAVVIAGTGSYFGRANPEIWEWLKSRLGIPNA